MRIVFKIVFVFCHIVPLLVFGQKDIADSTKQTLFKNEFALGIPMLPSLFNNFGIQVTRKNIPNPKESPILWLSIMRDGKFFFPINFSYKRQIKIDSKLEINGIYYMVPSTYSLNRETIIPYFMLYAGIEKKLNKRRDGNINLNYGVIIGYINSQKYWNMEKLQSFIGGGSIGISFTLPLSDELYLQTGTDLAISVVNNRGRNISDWNINAFFPRLFGLNIGYKF